MNEVWCGIDWSEGHHDIAVIDDRGAVLVTERISDDIAGLGRLTVLILDHRSDGLNALPIAIETTQGLLVAALRSAGADVYAINPLSVSRVPGSLFTEQIEERHRRRARACQHLAHRQRQSPTVTARQRPSPGHQSSRPRTPGRHLGSAADHQQGAFFATATLRLSCSPHRLVVWSVLWLDPVLFLAAPRRGSESFSDHEGTPRQTNRDTTHRG